MNSADTESSANIDVNAFAIIEETERTFTLPMASIFPFCERVSVVTISSIGAFFKFSIASSEKIPCVATTLTVFAPFSFRIFAAAAIVPPVSIMSSTRMACLSSTSPITVKACTTLCSLGSLFL